MNGQRVPWLTVVTAAYRAGATIGRTLASVGEQTAAGIEHVVVDGGSTDGTVEQALAAPHRPRVVSQADHGVYDAFNRGLALARGEFVQFLGADDVYAAPTAAASVRAALDRDPGLDLVHGDVDWVDARGRVVRTSRFHTAPGDLDPYRGLAVRMHLIHTAVVMRRSTIVALGGFDATYRVAADYALVLSAWRAGSRFAHLPEVLVRMGVGGTSERLLAARGLEVYRAARRLTGARRAPLLEALRFAATSVLGVWAPGLASPLRRLKPRLQANGPSGERVHWTDAGLERA